MQIQPSTWGTCPTSDKGLNTDCDVFKAVRMFKYLWALITRKRANQDKTLEEYFEV